MELQEQAEVSAKVMKEQFDQTLFAFSPSLTTPPQFLPVLLLFQAYTLLLRGEEEKVICVGHRNFNGLKRNCCTKCPLVGVTRDEPIQTLGEQHGDRRFVAALGEFITHHGGGAAILQNERGAFRPAV